MWLLPAHPTFSLICLTCSRRAEPTDLSVAMLLNDLVPLCKPMSEQIDALRKGQGSGTEDDRCRGGTRPAENRGVIGTGSLFRQQALLFSTGCLALLQRESPAFQSASEIAPTVARRFDTG